MRTNVTRIALFPTLTLLLCPLSMMASPPSGPSAPDAVVLTGWLQAHDMDMSDVTLMVEVDGQPKAFRVSGNGRFMVNLPAERDVMLRFEKPGHVPKEVLVDTRHALKDGRRGRQRRVQLGVVLEPERHMAGLTYQGPVGTIAFDADGGCVAVDHHRHMVPARQRHTMVF